MTVSDQNCHLTADGPMLLTHGPDCTSAGCGGCSPCPEAHCEALLGLRDSRPHCGAHVAAPGEACGLCVAKGRHAILTIVDLSALLLPAAITEGRLTSESVNLAGPAPDPYTRTDRNLALKAADRRDWIEDDDPFHPFAVLGRWAMMTRDSLGLGPQEVFTIASFADHLTTHLTTLARLEVHGYPDMLRELRACRQHLESVLHNSHLDETGVPCPTCSSPGEPGPPLRKRYVKGDTTGATDFWKCPRCREKWSEADYRLRVGRDARHHADRLTAAQVEETYRVRQATLRKWAERGKVARLGKDSTGRTLYRVADILRERETARVALEPVSG